MTVVVLRPNSTSVATGFHSGAANDHAATSDNTDSSYFEMAVNSWEGGFTDLSLPADAVVKTAAIRLRTAYDGTPGQVRAYLTLGATTTDGGASITSWSSPTTYTALQTPAGASDSDIDNATARFASVTGVVRVYESYLDVTYVEQPDVTPTGPTGTVDDTNQPTVTWTVDLDADGGAQARYEVRVFSYAQYSAGGFNPVGSDATAESGLLTGAATSWHVNEPLPDDTYRAYVQVSQVFNDTLHSSGWDYVEFEIEVDLPAVPTIVVTSDNVNGRLVIDIDPNSGDATTDYFELQRSLDGGSTWTTVRQLIAGRIPAGSVTVYDYEAENGIETHYRAHSLHDYSGLFAASAWATDTATWQGSEWWLKHPNKPALNILVTVRALPEIAQESRSGTFQALGSTRAIVVSDTPGPKTGTITLRALTLEAQAALDALIFTGRPVLLLQSPPGDGGPGYLVFGAHRRQRIVDQGNAVRVWEVLDLTVVESPDGDVLAWP